LPGRRPELIGEVGGVFEGLLGTMTKDEQRFRGIFAFLLPGTFIISSPCSKSSWTKGTAFGLLEKMSQGVALLSGTLLLEVLSADTIPPKKVSSLGGKV
jgi:hypothetical protein